MDGSFRHPKTMPPVVLLWPVSCADKRLYLSKKYSLSHGTCFAQRLPKCVESHLGTDHRTTRPCGCCKASVQRFMPLSLQLFSKQADVGSSLITLLALLLYMWYIFSAIIETVGAPCRSHVCIHLARKSRCSSTLRHEERKLACQRNNHTSTGRADGRMGSCVFVLSSLPGWLVSRLTRCCTCKVRLKAGR